MPTRRCSTGNGCRASSRAGSSSATVSERRSGTASRSPARSRRRGACSPRSSSPTSSSSSSRTSRTWRSAISTAGCCKSHGVDEGGWPGQGPEAPGAHDVMWFVARDLAFGEGAYPDVEPPENIARPESGRRWMPEVSQAVEGVVSFLMNLLVIEFRAEIGFASAQAIFRTPDLFAEPSGRGRARRRDHRPHPGRRGDPRPFAAPLPRRARVGHVPHRRRRDDRRPRADRPLLGRPRHVGDRRAAAEIAEQHRER